MNQRINCLSPRPHPFARTRLLGLALPALSALCLAVAAPAASAADGPPGHLPMYGTVPEAAQGQAQVVLFRKPSGGGELGRKAAHVYIDGDFHAGLMPQSFTRFCMAPGSHSIEAPPSDADEVDPNAQKASRMLLEGGHTYFVAVPEDDGGRPVAMERAAAEGLLRGMSEQRRFVSRVPGVEPCKSAATSTAAAVLPSAVAVPVAAAAPARPEVAPIAASKPSTGGQARVVLFRKPSDGGDDARKSAFVFINDAFHTALEPHSLTRFCLASGSYAIETLVADTPALRVWSRRAPLLDLEAGRTYFIPVPESAAGDAVPVPGAEAQPFLEGAAEQLRFASQVPGQEACL